MKEGFVAVQVGKGIKVHCAPEKHPRYFLCGSGIAATANHFRNPRVRVVDAEVTCKKCLQAMERQANAAMEAAQ